jgi:hypothetical protein
MWAYTAKPIDCAWNEEDIVLMQGVEEDGLMIT